MFRDEGLLPNTAKFTQKSRTAIAFSEINVLKKQFIDKLLGTNRSNTTVVSLTMIHKKRSNFVKSHLHLFNTNTDN